MKTRALLIILMIGMITGIYAQKSTIILTFTADNNGQHVPLNSILIENLTQGGDTTLYAPDTVLVLDYITSIGNNLTNGENTLSISQNYPNPFKGKTEVNLYLPEKGHINISVRDILGSELINYENTLNGGNHTFAFHSGNHKYYLLTVTRKQTSKTIKMLNANINTAYAGKCKIVYNGYEDNKNGFKSQKAINNFGFSIGDELKYTAYTDIGDRTITDSPMETQTYTFHFASGEPCPSTPTVTYEGQTYNTVQIGTQCWFKENLNVGTMIDGGGDQTNNNLKEKYCYDNDPANCASYGGLYQWNEMMQYYTAQGAQGICPAGWHIPTDAEWCTLTQFIDPTVICNAIGWSGTDVGTKMKSTTGWNSGGNGTNASGFTALPVGYRYSYGSFLDMGYGAYFWSSTEFSTLSAWYRGLYFNLANVSRYYYTKNYGFSVRCVQDN